jgi:hypothetical protein
MMAMEGQQNAGGQRRLYPDSQDAYYDSAPLADYPRMLYRKTDVEQTQESADALSTSNEPPMVINRFDAGGKKVLCETIVANNLDDAETLSRDGWEVSPAAAYGMTGGLAAATSAKDDEIAALKAQLAARDDQPERRGPGRPPKVIEPA